MASPTRSRVAESTVDDPVRVASISKLVVAVGVMELVERGRLDLDGDVSRWLGWRLRNPAFPDRPITLRMLLSHTSSVRDHDDQYAIPLGATVQATMADPRSWDTAHGPGDNYFTYGNMNFPIVGSIVERVTGERFDVWMRREVLEPMTLDACYNWPTCSDAAVARAVELDQGGKPVKDDLHGRRPDCPVLVEDGEPCDLGRWKLGDNGSLFAPQGGLRTSARGLARIGRMLLNGGTLDGVRILSAQSVDLLVKQVWRFDGSERPDREGLLSAAYGLATQQIPNPRRRLRRRHGDARRTAGRPCRRRLRDEGRVVARSRARPRHRLFRHRRARKGAARRPQRLHRRRGARLPPRLRALAALIAPGHWGRR